MPAFAAAFADAPLRPARARPVARSAGPLHGRAARRASARAARLARARARLVLRPLARRRGRPVARRARAGADRAARARGHVGLLRTAGAWIERAGAVGPRGWSRSPTATIGALVHAGASRDGAATARSSPRHPPRATPRCCEALADWDFRGELDRDLGADARRRRSRRPGDAARARRKRSRTGFRAPPRRSSPGAAHLVNVEQPEAFNRRRARSSPSGMSDDVYERGMRGAPRGARRRARRPRDRARRPSSPPTSRS